MGYNMIIRIGENFTYFKIFNIGSKEGGYCIPWAFSISTLDVTVGMKELIINNYKKVL
jgi:hypothetical protein